jgi:tRNA(Ile)-lysidine synthase
VIDLDDVPLLAPGQPVLVLYSGGRDSTCLLDVAVQIAGEGAVGALHVNYGLRDAAAADERHCSEICQRLGIPLEIRRPGARPASGNLQAWAREFRYMAARELAGDTEIAAGHTATDQVETILYRLASSPSRRALLGMRAREGRLIRPLLGFTRDQTTAHCRDRGLPWREDESNESDAYARGRVRGALVPALRAIHPAAEQNVLALSAILRDEAELLESLVQETIGSDEHIELARLRELPIPLQKLVVQRLADAAAGMPAPGTPRRITDITGLGEHAELHLPHGVKAVVRRGVLRFERT